MGKFIPLRQPQRGPGPGQLLPQRGLFIGRPLGHVHTGGRTPGVTGHIGQHLAVDGCVQKVQHRRAGTHNLAVFIVGAILFVPGLGPFVTVVVDRIPPVGVGLGQPVHLHSRVGTIDAVRLAGQQFHRLAGGPVVDHKAAQGGCAHQQQGGRGGCGQHGHAGVPAARRRVQPGGHRGPQVAQRGRFSRQAPAQARVQRIVFKWILFVRVHGCPPFSGVPSSPSSAASRRLARQQRLRR